MINFLAHNVTAQEASYIRTPTPLPAPPPTVIYYSGTTETYFSPQKNMICWIEYWGSRLGREELHFAANLFIVKFTEDHFPIPVKDVWCEAPSEDISPQNRASYLQKICCADQGPTFWERHTWNFVYWENNQVYVTATPSLTATPTATPTTTSSTTPSIVQTETTLEPTLTTRSTTTPTRTVTPTAASTQTATPTATPTWTQTPSATSTQAPSPEPQPTSTIELVLPTRTRQPQRPQVPTPQPIVPVITAIIPAPTSEVNVEIVIPPAVSIVETLETLNMATVEALIETRVAEKPKVEITQTPTKEIKVTETLVPVSSELLDLDSPSLIQREFDTSLNWFKPKKGDICFGENINNKAKVIAEFTADYFRQIKFIDVKCYSSKDISTVELFVILTSKGERYEIAIFPEMDIYPAPSSTP